MLWPFARTGNTDVMHALVTRTLSSHGHGCSGHSHALVTRTVSSCIHGCSVAIRTHWQHGRYHRADMDALWPFARAGNTDDIIARTWVLWPFARAGNTDVVIVQTWMLCGHSHALATRTLSSPARGHGCSGHSHALVTRTLSSRGRTHW